MWRSLQSCYISIRQDARERNVSWLRSENNPCLSLSFSLAFPPVSAFKAQQHHCSSSRAAEMDEKLRRREQGRGQLYGSRQGWPCKLKHEWAVGEPKHRKSLTLSYSSSKHTVTTVSMSLVSKSSEPTTNPLSYHSIDFQKDRSCFVTKTPQRLSS